MDNERFSETIYMFAVEEYGAREVIRANVEAPMEMDEKVRAVKYTIAAGIAEQFSEYLSMLAEDIVFGRIDIPDVVEVRCSLS